MNRLWLFNNRRNRTIARSLTILIMVGVLTALPLSLPGSPNTAQAGCWKDGPLCDIINRYSIVYNGGFGAGSYDISFNFRHASNGICGFDSADFWSIDCGSGSNQVSWVIRVYPCDIYRIEPFTVYIKVKGYDVSGNPLKTGVLPTPFTFYPTDFTYVGQTISYYC